MKDMQGIDGAKLIRNVECLSCHQTESEHAYGAPGKSPTVRCRQGNYLDHLHHGCFGALFPLEQMYLWTQVCLLYLQCFCQKHCQWLFQSQLILHSEWFFSITGFDPTLPLSMELSMTNATWQWVHIHRTHWSQYVAYHSKAASLWNDIWETLLWCQLQSNIAGVWSDILSNQLIPVNLRIICDTVLPRAVIHRLEIGVDINFCFSLLHQLTTGLEVIGSPSTPNWSLSRRDNLTEQVGKTGTCLVYAPCAA